MAGTLLVDYSTARPDLATVKAAGYGGIARYLAPLPNAKVITVDELHAAHDLGLTVVLVWETSAARAGEGLDAGREDRDRANDMATDLGWPLTRPIYYAVDYDALPESVEPYFLGLQGARPVGAYGSLRVVEHLLDMRLASFAWQTVAWSHGQVSTRAHLYQRLEPTVPDPIPSTDENVALTADFGAWLPGQIVAPPTSSYRVPQEEEAMQLVFNPHVAGEVWAVAGILKKKVEQTATMAALEGGGVPAPVPIPAETFDFYVDVDALGK